MGTTIMSFWSLCLADIHKDLEIVKKKTKHFDLEIWLLKAERFCENPLGKAYLELALS